MLKPLANVKKLLIKINFNQLFQLIQLALPRVLAEGNDKSIAAIASESLSKTYKLKILEKNIEDEKGNVTRFSSDGKNIEQPEFK